MTEGDSRADLPAWVGWHFDGAVWHRVCTGSTIHECSAALSRAVPRPRSNLDFCLTTGAVPRDIRRREP